VANSLCIHTLYTADNNNSNNNNNDDNNNNINLYSNKFKEDYSSHSSQKKMIRICREKCYTYKKAHY